MCMALALTSARLDGAEWPRATCDAAAAVANSKRFNVTLGSEVFGEDHSSE